MAAPTLTLDDFARLTARIDSGEPRDRVLADAGLDVEAWLEVQAKWLERMAKRTSGGQPALHRRYLELLDEHRRKALDDKRRKKALDGEAPRPPEDRGSPLLARQKARPAQAAPLPAPRPALQVAPPVAPPPVAQAAKPPDRSRFASTMAIPEMSFDLKQAMPFAQQEQPAKKNAPRRDGALPFAPPSQAEDPMGGTHDLPPSTANKVRADLPFQPTGASARAGTSEIRPEDLERIRRALPFSGGAAASSPRPRPPIADGALPFKAPAPSGPAPSNALPQLTVEQYAWLCAMLELSPEREGELLSWLRISPTLKGQLDAQWRHDLRRDHVLKARFDREREKYLRQSG